MKIFSYLPNPRVWKALIAAEFSGAEIEVVGDKPKHLGKWLWDFNAEELPDDARHDDSPHARKGRRGFSGTLFKTDDFLKAHPFGTVPAAFSPNGAIGIFEFRPGKHPRAWCRVAMIWEKYCVHFLFKI